MVQSWEVRPGNPAAVPGTTVRGRVGGILGTLGPEDERPTLVRAVEVLALPNARDRFLKHRTQAAKMPAVARGRPA